ncbi:MAG: hypothetical protein HOO67_01610 [Candidatus Peribacteraceae bacterium]|nr:hypothetical protein [Candidatus Peribacteraceae bacterium]
MNSRTIQYMSIALFVMLIVWGGYTLLYYLGVPYHGAALMSDASIDSVTASCDATSYICRGISTLTPFIWNTIARAEPFLWYLLMTLFVYLGFIVWKYSSTKTWNFHQGIPWWASIGVLILVVIADRGFVWLYPFSRLERILMGTEIFAILFVGMYGKRDALLNVTWAPWKILLLFVASVWLFSTTLSFGSVNGAPVRFYPEPTKDTYNVSEPALEALHKDYEDLLARNCLTSYGQSEAGAQLYSLRMRCIQTAFVTRILTQVLFVLALLFEFLVLGRSLLHWASRHSRRENSGFSSPMLEAIVSVGLGACGMIVLLWCIAVAGLYVAKAGWILAVAIPIAGFPHARYWLKRFLFHTWEREYTWWDLSLLLGWLLISYIALNFLEVVRPFPIGWDDLGSYLNRPRLLVSYGHFIASMSPFDWTYLTSVGFLLFGYNAPFGSTASMMVNWSAGLLAAMSVFVFARTFLGKKAGFLSALFYCGLPLIGHFSFADMKIDNAIFFFSALAILMLLLAVTPPQDEPPADDGSETQNFASLRFASLRLIFLSGLFIGFAFATKVTAAMSVFALGAILLGATIHPVAFVGGALLTFAALAKQNTFSIDEILLRATGVAVSESTSTIFLIVLTVLGVACIAAPLVRKRHALLPVAKLCAVFGLGMAAAILPWILHNNIESGRIIPRLEFSAPNNLSPGVEITNLPPELAVNLEDSACKPTGAKEELDRYWGFEHGWSHYLTLPWRTVMNLDSTGYYVTTLPALLLFPLLLLLPYFWKKESRWLRWLTLGTFVLLLQWMFVANGIPWYGVSMLLGLIVGIEALVIRAPDTQNRVAAGILIGFSLIMAFGMRFWQFEQQRNIFEYSMGKVSADAMREITIPYYGGISEIVVDRHGSVPGRPYLYRVGTFIAYFIPKNLEVIAISDHQLDVFNCLYQERNPELTTKRFKALGFNSIVFDMNTPTIERDAQGSLHKKVNAFVAYVNDKSSGMQVVLSDEKAGIAFILIP